MPSPASVATKDFLEQRYARGDSVPYRPHQPIHGIESGEPGQFLRLARTLRLITWLEALRPQSVLDLGCAEGYIANLIRLRYGCPVLGSDLSVEACNRAAELYGLPAIAGDLTRLPLRPGCADVVVLSEVFEHLPDPQAGLSAALYYARRYVVFSTQELCASACERRLRLALADADAPHAELNFVTRADFTALFGRAVALAPQFRRTRRRLLRDVPRAQWRSHVEWLAQPRGWTGSEGLLAVISLDGAPLPRPPTKLDPALSEMLLTGPPCTEPEVPPWDWLDGCTPAAGLTFSAPAAQPHALHPLLQNSAAIFDRLHLSPTPCPAATQRRAARALRWLERCGYLTCADPLAVKLRWLTRQALA
jgi:SAM-dependent methyltransferase